MQRICFQTVTRCYAMAQWWEHSPPTNVAQVRFPDPASNVGWVCWFSTLHQEVFSGNSGFPSSQKPTFDLIVLIVNFSCSVPSKCSSARTTRHLNKLPFLFLLNGIVKFPNLRFLRQLERITVNHLFSIFTSTALLPVHLQRALSTIKMRGRSNNQKIDTISLMFIFKWRSLLSLRSFAAYAPYWLREFVEWV